MKATHRAVMTSLAVCALAGYLPLSAGAATSSGQDAEQHVSDSQRERARAASAIGQAADTSFYETPDKIPAEPGVVVRREATTFLSDPVTKTALDVVGSRVMYSTTDRAGKARVATGAILTPKQAWDGPGKRPVVGFAPGSQGLADHCAPSRQLTVGNEYEIINISALLKAGYTVAITDYIGLGTEGEHTYMIKDDQAHALLDVVRAAHKLPDHDATPDAPTFMVGYSQGGGASLAAAEAAATYAPELQISGASAGAVPADLIGVGSYITGGLFSGLTSYAVSGLAESYELDLGDILNEHGMERFEALRQTCVFDAVFEFAFDDTRSWTKSGERIDEALVNDARFNQAAQEQLLGTTPPGFPMHLTHTISDDVIPFKQGRTIAQNYCRAGTDVEWHPMISPGHLGGLLTSLPRVRGFLDGRVHNKPVWNGCWALK